jgi:hypothetical protein
MRMKLGLGPRLLAVALALLGSLCAVPAGAGDRLLSISPGGGNRPPDPTLRTIDSANGSTIPGASVTITLAGRTVVGGTGLARHPQSGVLYALLKISGSSFRRLVTLDEHTGVATDIGDTGHRFAGIAFASNGTLYAVEGDGGGVPEALFTLNTTNATSTLFQQLGAGTDGETIAFDPDDGFLYHASGIGTPNHTNGEKFEKIDLGSHAATPITLSGFDYEELASLTYLNGGFYAGDIGNATTDNPRFFRITPSGAVTFLGNMDHVSKGLVLAAPPVPALPVPMAAALALSLLLAGRTMLNRAAVRRERGRSPA